MTELVSKYLYRNVAAAENAIGHVIEEVAMKYQSRALNLQILEVIKRDIEDNLNEKIAPVVGPRSRFKIIAHYDSTGTIKVKFSIEDHSGREMTIKEAFRIDGN